MNPLNRNEPPNWSKSLIGALTLSAVMSALILKLFSDLALAAEAPAPAPPVLDAPSEVLGTYEITDIVEDSSNHEGSICEPYTVDLGDDRTAQRPPSKNCGKKIWLVRSEDKVALLDVKSARGTLASFALSAPLASRSCETTITRSKAKKKLFNSGFCSAILNPEERDDRNDVFLFIPGAGAANVAALFLMSAGGTSYRVKLPKGITVPDEIEIEKRTFAMVFFIPTSSELVYKLKRIQD